jgi:hypothetical protein
MPMAGASRTPEPDEANARGPNKQTAARWLRTAIDIVRNNGRTTLVALVTSLGGLGFFLSPARDYVYHVIWHENAALRLGADREQISLNDQFELDLIVVPEGIPISSGIISVTFPADKLSLLQPTGTIETKAIGDTTVAAKLMFRALAHGPVAVDIHFTTRYGQYSVSRSLLVLEPDQNHHPSKTNLSGTWNFRMGGLNGELHIEDASGKILGHYELENGETGQVRGVRGLAAFQVSFSNGHGHDYSIECSLSLSDSFVELKGEYFNPKSPKTKATFFATSLT